MPFKTIKQNTAAQHAARARAEGRSAFLYRFSVPGGAQILSGPLTDAAEVIEAVESQALRNYVRIRGGVADDLRHAAQHLHRHGSNMASRNPAEQLEPPMSIAAELSAVKDALEQGTAWHAKAHELLPVLLGRVAEFEANPVVQALQGTVLTPEVEQIVAATIKAFAAVLPQAPAQPEVQEGDHPEQSAA